MYGYNPHDDLCRHDAHAHLKKTGSMSRKVFNKGRIDRAIRPGLTYEFLEGDSGEGIPWGLLKASVAVVFNTSNTQEQRENAIFGGPLETIWKNCVFGHCGVDSFCRRMFSVVVTSTETQRKAWLDEAGRIVGSYFPSESTLDKKEDQ